MSTVPLLRLENIHKRFGQVHAVKGVSMDVHKGEVVGLIGNNGAGKSTLIKTIIGVSPATSGKFYWDGEEVEIRSIKDSRALGIEAVYQEQAVFDQLSIVKNVFMGREIVKKVGPLRILDYRTMREIVAPLLQQMGLSVPSLDHEIRFCSGGERQGVAIARAMYFKARMVILDEPTNALSVEAQKKVLSFIEQLKDSGISVILISHNMGQVYSVVDRIVLISHGMKTLDVDKDDISRQEIEDLLADAAGEGGRRHVG
jgi:simple sugar transport system ATP-binding protein